jgi:phosphohistidine phosphatase
MKVYLVRHAIAEEKAASKKDADRALTEEGREKMERTAAGLRAMDVAIDVIASSPLRRARETAEIVGEALGKIPIEIVPELASGEDPRDALRALKAFARFSSVAAVGHQPDLGHLASLLLTGNPDAAWLPFKKGGIACLETDFAAKGGAVLEWHVPPNWLRAVAKTKN